MKCIVGEVERLISTESANLNQVLGALDMVYQDEKLAGRSLSKMEGMIKGKKWKDEYAAKVEEGLQVNDSEEV